MRDTTNITKDPTSTKNQHNIANNYYTETKYNKNWLNKLTEISRFVATIFRMIELNISPEVNLCTTNEKKK